MTTEIEYLGYTFVFVKCSEGEFSLNASEINRHHEGVWNSRVLAFVPQPGKYPDVGYNSGGKYPPFRTVTQDTDTFSDGTPVASYEQFN